MKKNEKDKLTLAKVYELAGPKIYCKKRTDEMGHELESPSLGHAQTVRLEHMQLEAIL